MLTCCRLKVLCAESAGGPGLHQHHAQAPQAAPEDDGFGDFAAAEDASAQSANDAPGQQDSHAVTDR